jgi:hypothetical protein
MVNTPRRKPRKAATMTPLAEPHITIALAEQDIGNTLVIVRSDCANLDAGLTSIRIDLDEAQHDGHHGLAQRIGSMALSMLQQAHLTVFANYPLLTPFDQSDFERARIVITELLTRSNMEHTSAYVSALDTLFERNASVLANTNLPAIWPTLRETLLRHPPN